MGLAQYTDFLPDGTAFARLCDWMQHLVGDEFAWSLTLVVRHREVPQTRLGQRLGNGARLGWTSWLDQHGQRTHDADEVRLPMSRRGGRAFRSPH
jgi:predicted component of type VI protein secretion system